MAETIVLSDTKASGTNNAYWFDEGGALPADYFYVPSAEETFVIETRLFHSSSWGSFDNGHASLTLRKPDGSFAYEFDVRFKYYGSTALSVGAGVGMPSPTVTLNVPYTSYVLISAYNYVTFELIVPESRVKIYLNDTLFYDAVLPSFLIQKVGAVYVRSVPFTNDAESLPTSVAITATAITVDPVFWTSFRDTYEVP